MYVDVINANNNFYNLFAKWSKQGGEGIKMRD